MRVEELIEKLKKMPPDANVLNAWDGALRGDVDVVWLARSGLVGLGAEKEPLYYESDRPEGAPTEIKKI